MRGEIDRMLAVIFLNSSLSFFFDTSLVTYLLNVALLSVTQ